MQGETWADGDVLYLSPTTAGNLTNIKPNGATGHIVIIGYVEYAHANNGKIYVKIMNCWELDELHNVYISSVANNEVLVYESATDLWKNKSIATALGYTPANDSLVMHLAGTETATGVKTFSIGLATTTGDNFLNTSSGNSYVGYSAVAASPLKFNVKDALRVEYTANRFVDIKVNPSLSDYAYIQASNTTGFSIVSSGTLFLRPNDASNTIYFGSYVIQKDITASALYGSSSVIGRGFEMTTNVPFVVKSSINSGGGTIGAFIFHGTDSANFLHRVTGSTAAIHTIKTTGQLQLHNYTTTTSFTGTVAGLLGFDSSGNIITTSASGGGISGSGTAGQVTYWSGTSAVTGSSNLFWDNTNGRLGIGTNAPSVALDIKSNLNIDLIFSVNNSNSGALATSSFAIGQSPNTSPYNALYVSNFSSGYTTSTFRLPSSVSFTAGPGVTNGMTFVVNNDTAGISFWTGGTATQKIRLFNGGNVLIQNGGTFTDNNYRLDVNGTGATAGALRVTGGLSLFQGGKMTIAASTTSYASLNIPSGTAPTSPANGDMWNDGTNVYFRIGGTTKTFTLV